MPSDRNQTAKHADHGPGWTHRGTPSECGCWCAMANRPETTAYRGHVDLANSIMGWDIASNGGAQISEKAVSLVDRMVASLVSIMNGWCADPQTVARRALYGDE